jgi:hypothetical protein
MIFASKSVIGPIGNRLTRCKGPEHFSCEFVVGNFTLAQLSGL